MNPVKLSELVDSIEMQDDETQQYLHKETGKIITIFDDGVFITGEDAEDTSDWDGDKIEELKDKINEDDCYVELPTKYDIHEYRIMEDFCDSIKDEKLRDTFFITIRGSGAFRRFKDMAYRHELLDSWYEFKTKVLKEKAIEWCKENNIDYTE